MIVEVKTCGRCGSEAIRKNSHTTGRPKDHCRACNHQRPLHATAPARAARYAQCRSAAGRARFAAGDRAPDGRGADDGGEAGEKKALAVSAPPAVPVRRRPRLEFDALWSFVGCKARKVWL